MALPRIGFNEGSLLRRTLLHVASFVLGSVAFIGLVSFVLVSIARGLLSPRGEATDDDSAATVASAGAKPAPAGGAPLVRPARAPGRRGPTVPTAPPSKDD